MSKLSKGFSLIELMIAITIIGVLSSIILNTVSNSRARAYDSKIKQQLSSFRIAAEIYFLNQTPNGYGPIAINCNAGLFNDFSQSNGTPGIYIASGNLPDYSTPVCQSTDTAYAVKATMYSGTDYWCVDSKGASRLINDGNPSVFCP